MALERAGVQLTAEGATKFGADMDAAGKAVDQFAGVTVDASGRLRDAHGRFVAAGGAAAGFGGAVHGAAGQVESSSQVMIGALRQVGVIAVDAMVAAGKAIGSFVAGSISAAGDFEAGMNQFSAVAGGALDEAGLKTKDFRDLFIKLGKELPVSTAEVQQAATEMIKGGIDPATLAAGGLKQNIQFAAAAMGGDLVQAATVSAKILGGWAEQGATADEKARLLTQATDLLTKAANASTVDVHELALGLYNVQGTAKATGLSLSETTTALAELSPRFASSAEAGNSLKNFLVRLQPTTAPAAGAMQALGLYTEETGSKFFDAQGKFVGVAKASQLLQDATKDLSDAQRVQLLQTIFGNDAMNTASALAEMGAKGYDDMSSSMEKANGVQANAQTMQQGYNVALDNFKGSIEALQITIGSAFLPLLTDLFNNVLAPAINTLTTLAGAITGDQDAFNQLSPALQAIVTGIGGIGATISQFLPAITGMGAAFLSSENPIQTFLDTLSQISPGFALLRGVVEAALPPIQSIVESVFGIITGFVQKNGADMLADVQTVWGQIQNLITTILPPIQSIVQSVFGAIAQFLKDHGAEIQGFLRETWDSVMTIIKVALAIIQAVVVPAFQAIAQFISDNSAQIQQILSGAWEIIKGVIDAALTIIQGVLTAALQIIQGDWSGAWETIKGMISRVWDDIKLVIGGAIDIIKGVLSVAWDVIKGTAQTTWDGIKSTISTAIGGVQTTIQTTIDDIKSTLSTAWDTIQGAASDAWGRIASAVGDAFSGALSGITGTLNSIIDTMNQAIDAFNELPGPDIGHIPRLGYGTDFWQGGPAIVGDRGPELLYLPQGSRVVPAVAGMGSSGTIAAPASPEQIMTQQNTNYSYTTSGNTYNYSPTYGGTPRAPMASFLTMKAFNL